MKKFAIWILLTTMTATAWAGDAATLNFIGFSKTGRYLAFQQYGVTDGKGAAYATLYFLDVLDNGYQEKPIETSEDAKSGEPGGEAAQETVRQLNLEQAKDQLKSLDIIANNLGKRVISHLTYDTDIKPHLARFTLEPKSELIYEVNLEEHQAKSEADCTGNPTEVVGLTLTLKRGKDSKPKILQYDSKIPKSRGCPLGYHIQDIHTYKDKYIAVFIHVYTPGFEGKNMRYIVVTGTLN